jgi:isopenicillin N synthase-like dioxygenase
MNTFYETSRALRGEVLTVLEHALDLPSGRLTSLTDGNASCLRLNYYPACEVRDLQTGTKRISEHQDAGDITLLFQDKIGGLEIEDRQNQGKYLAVPNVQGPEIILNIGDTLQRWTNDRLRSTSHRVVLPQELLAASMGQVEARHSIAFFGKANRDATVGSLPDFVPPEQEPKYENITAWQYQKRRTDVLYG